MTGYKNPPTEHQFKPGHKLSKGRKGAKNKFSEAFLKDLQDVWNEKGKDAIYAVAKDRPQDLLKVAASLVPKEMTLNVNNTDEMTDAEMLDRLKELHDIVEPFVAGGIPGANGSMDKAGKTKTIN